MWNCEFIIVCYSRLPKGTEFDYDEHKEYDKAHSKIDDCSKMYPGCENF